MRDLEFNILNGCVKHNKIALDFSSNISTDIFLSEDASFLAKAFISYIKSFKGRPTRRALVERYSTNQYALDLFQSFFDKSDVTEYNDNDYGHDLDVLKNDYIDFKYKKIKEEFVKGDITPDIKSNIKLLEKEINDIKSINVVKSYNSMPIDGFVDQFKQSYIDKVKNPELGKGLLTGYSYLDYIKNGLRPSDLIIIAAETGGGKSMFMNNIAVQMWLGENKIDSQEEEFKKGCNVVYFSLEMPYEDCFQRTISRVADIPSYGVRDAKLSKNEAASLSKACKFMKKYPYKFEIIDVPRGLTVSQMEAMFEEIKQRYNPDVVFIDYLGLMENVDDSGDDWLALGALAGKVHEFARVQSVPVVTAVQLNRIDPEKRSSPAKSIGLHRIGRSALISTHATLIIQIESRADEKQHDDFVYHIIKNRHGESGGHATVYKNFAKCSITDIPYDTDTVESWAKSEDLSDNIDDIIGLL